MFAGHRTTVLKYASELLESRRLLSIPAGAPDLSFGDTGAGWTIADSGRGVKDTPSAMAVASDGKIVVVGDAQVSASNTDIFAMRFNADGLVDSSFGNSGAVLLDLSVADSARSVAVLDDGRIVIGGKAQATGRTDSDALVVRLNADGTLDPSFSGDGIVYTDFGTPTPAVDECNSMLVYPDGVTVIAGSSSLNFALARLRVDGSLDTSFGADGTGKVLAASSYQGKQIVQTTDGRLIVAGTNSGKGMVAIRYSADGVLDSAYGSAGKVVTTDYGAYIFTAIMPDDRLVVIVEGGGDKYIIRRFLPDGSADSSLDEDSSFTPYLWAANTYKVRGLALGSDGRIVMTGSYQNHLAVVRHQRDANYDPSFRSGMDGKSAQPDYGSSFINAGGTQENGQAMTILPNGQILVAGYTYNSATAQQDIVLARVDGSTTDNTLPIAATGGPYTTRENGFVRLDASSSTDADGRVRLCEWDFDYDGRTFNVDATGAYAVFNGAGIDGPVIRDVALRVTDSMDGVALDTTTVTVLNAPPAIAATGPDRATAGAPYTLNLSAVNDPLDTLTSWQINWGDGTPVENLPAAATSAGHVFQTSTTRARIHVTATDEDGTYTANQIALDPTFGGGKGFVLHGIDAYETAVQSIVDPITGKLYVLSSRYFRVLRFNKDGSLDPTWGTAGVAEVYMSSYGHGVAAMALQADGKVVVVGDYSTDVMIVRYTTRGEVDPAFATNGVYKNSYGNLEHKYPTALAIQSDGKILIAAESPLMVFRVLPGGSPDSTFGSGGMVKISTLEGANSISLLSGGKFVVGLASGTKFGAARFNSNGTLDLSFAGVGYAYQAGSNFQGTTGAIVQPDGKIIVAGRADGKGSFANYNFGFVRFNVNGTTDYTFGGNGTGQIIVDPGTSTDQLLHLKVAPDGGVFAAGGSFLSGGPYGQQYDPVIVKLTPSGVLDNAFAGGGILYVPMGPNSEEVYDITFWEDKLYAVGFTTAVSPPQDHLILRFNYGDVLVRRTETLTAPSTNLSASAINEGSSVTLSGAFSDADPLNAHTVRIDWRDGSKPEILRLAAGVSGYTANHIYADDDPTGTASDVFRISVEVDNGIDIKSATTDLLVRNVAPTTTLGDSRTVTEGTGVVLNPVKVDPGTTDTFFYSWQVTSDGNIIRSANTSSYTFIPPDEGTYLITLRLADDDGGEWIGSTTVTATNVPPSMSLGSDRSVNEGTIYTTAVSVWDAGSADIVTRSWVVYAPGNSVLLTSTDTNISFKLADNGVYRLALTVDDGDGGVISDEMLLTAMNVSPVLDYAGPAAIFLGQVFTTSLSVVDPGADTISKWTINWGDGTGTTTISNGSLGPLTHTFASAGAYTLSGTATDEDGTYSITSRTISVNPLPVLNGSGVLTVTGISLADSIAVEGNSTTLTVTQNGAQQTFPATSVVRVNVQLGLGNDALSYTGLIPGGSIDAAGGTDSILFAAGVSEGTVSVLGATGADTVRVNSGSLRTITFDGGSDTLQDLLYIDGSTGADEFVMGSGTLTVNTVDGAKSIAFSNIEAMVIKAGAGNDTIRLGDLPGIGNYRAATTLTIDGEDGADVFSVGSAGSVLTWTNGKVLFTGGLGSDSVSVDDSGRTAGTNYAADGSAAACGTGITTTSGANLTWGTVESVSLTTGSGADTITLVPSSTAALSLTAGAPTWPARPADTLKLSLSSASGMVHTPLGAGTGRYSFSNRQAITYSGVEALGTDLQPPTVSSVDIFDSASAIILTFSEDVYASIELSDLQLIDRDSGNGIPIEFSFTLVTSGQQDVPTIARWNAIAPLKDGNYRLVINAGSVIDSAGNANGVWSTDFFILSADANKDRIVNTQDFNILAGSFGASGRKFSQGNFDFDTAGNVDSIDFDVFVAQYGRRLTAPASQMNSASLFANPPLADRDDLCSTIA